jgi:hypothetical protein
MAKQESAGFIEQHVEKLVLLVCLVILGYAVSRWVMTSPREVEVVTATGSVKTVAPEKLDEKLVQSAERIWERHNNATAEVEPPYPGPSHFERLASTPFAPLLGDIEYVSRGRLPEVQVETKAMSPISAAQIAKAIPAPSAPALWMGQELRRLSEGELADENVAHGAADFDLRKMINDWQALLRPRGINARPVPLRIEIQRQQMLPDGTYGKAETVATVRAPGADGEVAEIPSLPDFTGENAQAIADAVDRIEQGFQSAIVRPSYWDIWWGGTNQWITWQRHLPRTAAMKAYAEALQPAADPAAAPAAAGGRLDEDEDETRSPAAPPEVTRVPPLGRLVDGKTVWWFHDVGLALGGQYRYRLRAVFVNPLYGKQIASVVKSPDDLKQAELASPWSDWSQKRRVPHPTEFFLTGYDSTRGTVQVTVFTRHMGRFIRRQFDIQKGQSIGGKASVRVPVPTLDGDTTQELRTVDFRTGAVALEVDFSRVVPSWGTVTTTTVAMIYLDEKGQLQTRTRSRDEASERRKELESLTP